MRPDLARDEDIGPTETRRIGLVITSHVMTPALSSHASLIAIHARTNSASTMGRCWPSMGTDAKLPPGLNRPSRAKRSMNASVSLAFMASAIWVMIAT